MAQVYPVGVAQTTSPSDRPPTLRTKATLALFALADPTTSYTATDHFDVSQFQAVSVALAITHVDATSWEWYYEWSPDGTTWYRDMNKATAAGTDTVTARAHTFASASVNLVDQLTVKGIYFRMQVKRTGGAATNKVAIQATLLGL